MYEIWLAVNILWEIALGIWPLLAGAALFWVVLMFAAARRAGWQAGWLPSAAALLVVAVAALLLLPGALHSSLAEMGYWIDWMTLAGLAAGFGAVAAAFAWPVSVLLRSH